MEENKKTDKKANKGIDTKSFIRQVSIANIPTGTQTVTECVMNENSETQIQDDIHSETNPAENEKQPVPKKRKAAVPVDYPLVFLGRYELKSRQGIYIEKETNATIKQIVHTIGDTRLTVSGFIENVLKHHFETYKEDINQLYEATIRKPIK